MLHSARDVGELAHECGVLSAPTGFGKTVIGSYLIASLGMRTLIVVPKAVLVSQWLERLGEFLQIVDDRPPLLTKPGRPSKRLRLVIGQIGGGKNKPSGLVDVATYQSLVAPTSWLRRARNPSFVADVERAERSIALAAPYASEKAVQLLEPSLRKACERGVDVRAYVSEPSSEDARRRAAGAVDALRSLGCRVDMCECAVTGIAVIDGRISWYGSLPLLGFARADDCSLRIVNVEVAADMANLIDSFA